MTATAERPAGAGWAGSLELGFAADASGATRLDRRAHRGPFLVQRPFFPEGREVCHVYLLHPPGGLVGGDELRLDLRVGEQARALVTTPAAGKAYRTLGPVSRQTQALLVGEGAALEWLPQETILYDGASVELTTTVDLAPSARFFGAETLCFGLPARGERFARGSCRQAFELRRAGVPLLIERGRFDGGAPVHQARWGLAGSSVLTLIAASPAPEARVLDRAREALAGGDQAGFSIVDDGGALVVRHLTSVAERARSFVQAVWSALRPALFDRAPVAPRIWFT
ncbi:MAG TPA: urease accessory protein UreD [Polyangia bacterium]|nr:urease accessory protein UreD [Polyangia bacterium]